ncbi:TlpA family protein disulfide reductase [Lacihabitans sp. LS3-19]|uniref:TlpA family protein disulfide reductase n=1 Tax=Lacihabitans sp. LS3-19 TaxID=2487335 RepID=UPI0020CDA952|nr:TlpA disulfide reductase family protein [Lacihabitans sp. LS3-19]MCP9769375.1 TlpA family protein disulfide reductase [Lacihabitans sp. LS3-19]
MKKLLFFLLGFAILSCKENQEIKSGIWRAEIPTVEGVLPFNIEIEKDKAFVINSDEKLAFDTLFFQSDSLHLVMQLFDAEIIAKLNGEEMNGIFRKKMADLSNREGAFKAKFNQSFRFENGKENKKLANKYSVVFDDGESTYEAVGIFKQTGNSVKGTFLTTTGDYRYLDGNVVGDSLKLSCFDGNHTFLFKAKIQNDSLVGGTFCYSLKVVEKWSGIKNEKAELPDPHSLTFLKPGFESLEFSFPDFDGHQVSLKDDRFKNKVTIVQVLGSWCPNCMDETRFLANFKKQNPNVEIIGLAFEKSLEPSFVKPKIERLKTRFGVNYPILLAGLNDKEDASKKLPMLNKIISFPTTIIIDKKGIVRQIHTGFSGPGTGEYYNSFVEDFRRFVEKLEKE